MFSVIRFDAGHTQQGNPRRVFVVFQGGDIVRTYDEGYRGNAAITDPKHAEYYTGTTIATTPAEYRELLKLP